MTLSEKVEQLEDKLSKVENALRDLSLMESHLEQVKLVGRQHNLESRVLTVQSTDPKLIQLVFHEMRKNATFYREQLLAQLEPIEDALSGEDES